MGIEENKKIAKEFTERLGRGDSTVVDFHFKSFSKWCAASR